MNLSLTKPTAKEDVDFMRNEAFKDKKALVVAVEGKDDAVFWSFVFDRSDFKDRYRVFKNYNFPNPKSSGKNTLAHYLPHTQRDFVICIDSDYDYLLENPVWQMPYVFQTYTYSIENYYCYVPSLNAVMNRATNLPLNTEGVLFEDIFIYQFSKTIYELLIESLQESISSGNSDEKKGQLGENIRLTFGSIDNMLTDLEQNVANKMQHLIITETFKKQLAEKGLTPETAYLFARGKDVLNSVFLKILKLIQEDMKSKKLLELAAIEEGHLRNTATKAYRMGLANVQTCLLENRNFTDCLLFEKIENDIRKAFQ
jgi:hypothetical protein